MTQAKSVRSRRVVLIGMPCWDAGKPFHSLAVVAGVVREAGLEASVHDLNIEFYHLVSGEERKYWAEEHNPLWRSEGSPQTLREKYRAWLHKWNHVNLPQTLWAKYRDRLHRMLDSILGENDRAMLCFSVNFSNRAFSIRAAKYLKSKRPSLPIMFGGVDCFPGEYNTQFLISHEPRYCDIICQGECEIAFKKYLEEFARTGDWRTSVPGFAYYDGDKLVNTGDTELPTLREKQPLPAFDLFDFSKYTTKGALPFFLSRGCVYKCNFCSEKPNFRKYRHRRAEEAMEELKAIIPHARPYADVPTISFADSILNANIPELERFTDLILESGLTVHWGGQCHIHRRMTRELLAKMKRAGFSGVFWGIESGSQHVVDLMNKKYSLDDAMRILRDCDELGIRQWMPILIGFPGEKPRDVVDTIEFIFRFREKPSCTIHLPSLVVVRPKSPLYERFSDFGLANNNYYDWHTTDAKNTMAIRVTRLFVVRQAHGNRDLSMANLVFTSELRGVDLDSPHTACDLFLLLRDLFSRVNATATFYRSIEQWRDSIPWWRRYRERAAELAGRKHARQRLLTPSLLDSLGTLEPEETKFLQDWLFLRKTIPAGRERLYGLILLALKTFKNECVVATEKAPT